MFKRSSERKLCRLQNYDYSINGYYFITICVQNMDHTFGQIYENKMRLNKYGLILKHCWFDLPNHYYNCKLDEFIIMPNHIHCIIVIDNDVGNGSKPFPVAKQHGLPEIIRSFKTFSSRRINELNPIIYFKWQKSYNDRIIRNEKELYAIRQYIKNNPIK